MIAYLYVNLREILFLIFWLIFILVLQNNSTLGTLLVVQCLGICLAVQGMQVQSLVRELVLDLLSFCALEPTHHNKDTACCNQDPSKLNKYF